MKCNYETNDQKCSSDAVVRIGEFKVCEKHAEQVEKNAQAFGVMGFGQTPIDEAGNDIPYTPEESY